MGCEYFGCRVQKAKWSIRLDVSGDRGEGWYRMSDRRNGKWCKYHAGMRAMSLNRARVGITILYADGLPALPALP